MQSVSDVFSVEAYDVYRNIAQTTQVSWKRAYSDTYRPFTIGVSAIGGGDSIASDGAVTSDWNNYQYFDESDYVIDMAYERALNMPLGGMTKALAEVRLDNTSHRFTPRYMGGNSELYTAILPRRPFIINAGFDHDGILDTLPQFVGVLTETPQVDRRSGMAKLKGADFIDFLQNKYLDQTLMFTSQRTDQVIENVLTDLGFATAQYELDYGINTVPFGLFEKGARYSDVINQLVQAENGHFYQDEIGRLRFENRQHWSNFPYFNVQRVLPTSMVLEAENTGLDHIVNVVEVNAKVRTKQPYQIVWQSASSIEIAPTSSTEIFVNFEDPVLQAYTPSGYTANTQPDGSGTDISSSVNIQVFDAFANAAKIRFYNSSTNTAYVTNVVIYGRPAPVTSEVYYREQRDLSVTAYDERPLRIDNNYIQDKSWAQSLAGIILNDFSTPENLQRIKIRALPELQLGDLISWQGRHWRIFGIKTAINAQEGFIQELDLLQREVITYFRIGISTIGGEDQIAP